MSQTNWQSVSTEIKNLESFEISNEYGFLFKCSERLPAAFENLEEVGRLLPGILASGQCRSHIVRLLKTVNVDELKTIEEQRRALRILAFIANGYVWGEETITNHLPAVIAKPLHALGKKLGRAPVLVYEQYALGNWTLLDPSKGPIVGNIDIDMHFLNGLDEKWFIVIHIEIEYHNARVLRSMGPAFEAVANNNVEELKKHLAEIIEAQRLMLECLNRMPESCDPYIYFNRVRPYIHGWIILKDGMIYDEVEEYGGRPLRLRGETGSQSMIIPCLDAFCGVVHQNDPLKEYLMEMRDYTPPGHRRFLEALEATGGIRGFVEKHSQDDQLVSNYNKVLKGIEDFRSKHLEYASSYIFKQSSKNEAINPHATGTGGTPFMPYLTKHRDESTLPSVKP